ncbi:MAG: hypothetical protein JWN14_830 [Chthonomonadales bacterium]|nr:hypothetical protein [Chthonomonadales bacterium]
MPEPRGKARLNYFTVAELKERGWTDTLIRDYLGGPDATLKNPRYACAAPMRLYLRDRAVAVEAQENWSGILARASKRKEAAQKATETKSQRLLAYVSGLQISITAMPLPEVTELACEAYNRRMQNIEEDRMYDGRFDFEWTPATTWSDSAFLQRITVNYLRHRLSRYDHELERLFGKVGIRDAYAQLNAKVYLAITEAYPALGAECNRQMERKFGGKVKEGAEAVLYAW